MWALGNGFPGRAIMRPTAARELWTRVGGEKRSVAAMWQGSEYQDAARGALIEVARVQAAMRMLRDKDLVVAELWDTS